MDFYFQSSKIYLTEKIFLISLLLFPLFVFAQGGIEIKNPLNATSVEGVVSGIIDFFFYIAIALAPLMWIIAGFLLTASAGDPQKINTAKRIALYAAIGFFVVMLAKALVAVLKRILK